MDGNYEKKGKKKFARKKNRSVVLFHLIYRFHSHPHCGVFVASVV